MCVRGGRRERECNNNSTVEHEIMFTSYVYHKRVVRVVLRVPEVSFLMMAISMCLILMRTSRK